VSGPDLLQPKAEEREARERAKDEPKEGPPMVLLRQQDERAEGAASQATV